MSPFNWASADLDAPVRELRSYKQTSTVSTLTLSEDPEEIETYIDEDLLTKSPICQKLQQHQQQQQQQQQEQQPQHDRIRQFKNESRPRSNTNKNLRFTEPIIDSTIGLTCALTISEWKQCTEELIQFGHPTLTEEEMRIMLDRNHDFKTLVEAYEWLTALEKWEKSFGDPSAFRKSDSNRKINFGVDTTILTIPEARRRNSLPILDPSLSSPGLLSTSTRVRVDCKRCALSQKCKQLLEERKTQLNRMSFALNKNETFSFRTI